MQHTFWCISLTLFCTTTKWNFLVTHFMEKMFYMLTKDFIACFPARFFIAAYFYLAGFSLLTPSISHFLTTEIKFLCFFSLRNSWFWYENGVNSGALSSYSIMNRTHDHRTWVAGNCSKCMQHLFIVLARCRSLSVLCWSIIIISLLTICSAPYGSSPWPYSSVIRVYNPQLEDHELVPAGELEFFPSISSYIQLPISLSSVFWSKQQICTLAMHLYFT